MDNNQSAVDMARSIADQYGYNCLLDAVEIIRTDIIHAGGQANIEKVQHIFDPDTGNYLGSVAPVDVVLRNGGRTEKHVFVNAAGRIIPSVR